MEENYIELELSDYEYEWLVENAARNRVSPETMALFIIKAYVAGLKIRDSHASADGNNS